MSFKNINVILLLCILLSISVLYILLMHIDGILEYLGYIGAAVIGLIVFLVLSRLLVQQSNKLAKFAPVLFGILAVVVSWFFLFKEVKEWSDQTREIVIKGALYLIAAASLWLFKLSFRGLNRD